MKHKPSFKKFLYALVPRRLPSPKELGRKIDRVMYSLKSDYQRQAAAAAKGK
jgi:hypothetical protein